MKRHLNTSYRLVWNHITGTLVVASELARSRGKCAGVAVVLSLAAVTSVPALAADTVVQAGETVSGGTLTNHDNQIVLGTANGMTISTGLEYGPDNEANTGGQWIQNPTMKIITRGEAMRIHRQHPASRLFPFCTGKYRWHGSAEAYTGREVQDIPGVLAVFAERRKDSFGPYVRLMSVTLN